MGKRGPVAVPNSAKILAGTFRKDRAKSAESLLGIPLEKTPSPPRNITDEAKAHWRELAPMLVELKTLTKSDVPLFRRMCEIFARADRCAAIADAAGGMSEGSSGQLVTHPMQAEARHWEKIGLSLAERFGLTPGARARIAPPQTTPTQKSPWDDL